MLIVSENKPFHLMNPTNQLIDCAQPIFSSLTDIRHSILKVAELIKMGLTLKSPFCCIINTQVYTHSPADKAHLTGRRVCVICGVYVDSDSVWRAPGFAHLEPLPLLHVCLAHGGRNTSCRSVLLGEGPTLRTPLCQVVLLLIR